MQNKKIKILQLPSDTAGVGSFRNIWPAQEMENKYSDEFFVEINSDFQNDIEYYKQFDIIHFHRQFGPYEDLQERIAELRKHGVIIIMDIDDYWIPPKTHPMYVAAIKEKLPEKITSAFNFVDYVTTTTNIFANYIKKYNSNVHVIENGIDMSQPMWQDVDTKKNDKVRITWCGGSSHLHDLQILTNSMNILHNDTSLQNKYQFVMCGYDTRGFLTEVGPNGEYLNTRPITPQETIWNKFEEIFTDKYNPKIVDEKYKKYLLKCSNEPYKEGDVYEGNYVRRWTLPLTRYGEHYNYCDVALAPLDENIFNEVKSELKIIEAGLKRKALIAQDFGIYKELIVDGVTGILVDKKDSVRGWYKAMKKVIEDKDYREMLADNLYNFVKDKYTLEAVTKNRVDFYKKVVQERDSKRIASEPKEALTT